MHRENIDGGQGQLLLRGRKDKKILSRNLEEFPHRKRELGENQTRKRKE